MLLRRSNFISHMNRFAYYKYRLWQLYSFPYYAFLSYNPVQLRLNRKNIAFYERTKKSLDDFRKELIGKLEKDGIATTHIDKLLPEGIFGEMLLLSRGLIARNLSNHAKKVFLMEFLAGDFLSEEKNKNGAFARFAYSPAIRAVVNEYFRMYSRMIFLNGNLAVPVGPGEAPMGSQRWHRDPGIYRICKVFLYLNDVDEGTGPFTYIAGSQPGGRWQKLASHRFFGHGSYYPKDGKVEEDIKKLGVPPEDLRLNTGKAGTIIFCNTMGVHKGGYATKGERIMITAFYKIDRGIKHDND